LIKRLDEVTKSSGGLFLPSTALEKPQQGEVLAAGSGKVQEDGTVTPLSVKVGDVVMFGKFSGSEIKLGGEDRLIMREDEVFGVL
jgi:chaperonin GroES